MDQNQDQNDNLFNFNQQPPQQSSEDQTSFSSGARAYETPSTPPVGDQPAFTPPPAYTPPPDYTPPPPVPPQQPPSKINRTWLIVIIILVVLCCCCLALGAAGWVWGDAIMEAMGLY